MFLEKKYIWVIVALLMSVWGCGYRFAGSGSLPGGITSVRVDMFKNNSAETGLENVITSDMIYEFTRKKKSAVTKSDQAGGVLTGTITSVRTDTIARKGESTSLSRRVNVTIGAKLTDRNGTVVWSVDSMSESEAYDVASGSQANELRKQDAVKNISKRLAENLFYRLTEDF